MHHKIDKSTDFPANGMDGKGAIGRGRARGRAREIIRENEQQREPGGGGRGRTVRDTAPPRQPGTRVSSSVLRDQRNNVATQVNVRL